MMNKRREFSLPLYVHVQGQFKSGRKELKIARHLTTGIHSGGDFAPPPGFGFARSVASLVPTQNLTHIWAGSVSQPKCRIPRTLNEIGLNFLLTKNG